MNGNIMNENTIGLIEKMADKLGTTSEYLWKVLLNQASLSATINLGMLFFSVLGAYGLYRLHVKFSTKRNNDGYMESLYEEKEEALIIPMVLAAILMSVFLVASLFSIPAIITGYIYPEYWAFDQILEVLKSK